VAVKEDDPNDDLRATSAYDSLSVHVTGRRERSRRSNTIVAFSATFASSCLGVKQVEVTLIVLNVNADILHDGVGIIPRVANDLWIGCLAQL
jgi:hypothetical protein